MWILMQRTGKQEAAVLSEDISREVFKLIAASDHRC